MVQNKRFVFKQVPDGYPKPGQDLAVEVGSFDLDAEPPKGGLTTKNFYFSFDPYLRGRMRPAQVKSYNQALQPGDVIKNSGVAKVLKSDSPKAKEGDYIVTFIGAEEYSSISAAFLEQYAVTKIPTDTKLPLSNYCGVLGMPGRTAYSSLYEIAEPKKGETIWVSAAAGPVGQLVGQLAKHEGLKVIGSVGSDEKLDFIVNKMGFDAGFNYKKEKPLDAIQRLAPDGIDIYYDNVGGEQLEAAIETLKKFGRIVACGAISQYNIKPENRYPIKNTLLIVGKSIKYQGFIVNDKNMGPKYFKDHLENVTKWLVSGSFVAQEDVTDGIEKAPEGFVGMLKGDNFGKAVLKIADVD